MKVKDGKAKYIEKKDENAGKEIDETDGGKQPKRVKVEVKKDKNGKTIVNHYGNTDWEPSEEEQERAEKDGAKKNGNIKAEHYHFPANGNLKKDENAGKEILNMEKLEGSSKSKSHGDGLEHPHNTTIKHFGKEKPTKEEMKEAEENSIPFTYDGRNKNKYFHKHYWYNPNSSKASKYELLGDENAGKEIETSLENGYSTEQAKAVPNDVLVKDDKDADIKTDDASPKNLEEIKDGNLDAKISPDSDFKLSPEMEKGLIANGGKKPEKK